MQQELGMSNYGGGHNPKTRLMITEEEEYMEGLYATNDSGRDPRASGSYTGNNPGRDSRKSRGYAKGNTPGYKVIKFACPAGCDHETSQFPHMVVGARRSG